MKTWDLVTEVLIVICHNGCWCNYKCIPGIGGTSLPTFKPVDLLNLCQNMTHLNLLLLLIPLSVES
jgi:hypothetical protein